MRNLVCVLLIWMGGAYESSGQMQLLKLDDGLAINYKWEKGKSDEQLLLIEVINNNDVAVDFEMTLFLMKGIKVLESTGKMSLCVGAGKSLKPKISGLVFDVKTPKDQIDSIDLDDLNIVKADRKNCHL